MDKFMFICNEVTFVEEIAIHPEEVAYQGGSYQFEEFGYRYFPCYKEGQTWVGEVWDDEKVLKVDNFSMQEVANCSRCKIAPPLSEDGQDIILRDGDCPSPGYPGDEDCDFTPK